MVSPMKIGFLPFPVLKSCHCKQYSQIILTCNIFFFQADPLYTYTVITVDAHPDFAHIHDRMPAILDGSEAIHTWLDPALPTSEAIQILHPSSTLAWYPVSEVVNSVKNKSPECITKIDLK